MYKHILIPTDGSALSNEALIRSLQLAKTFGAAVTILTVEEPFHVFSMGSAQLAASLNDYQDQIRSQAERLLNEAAAQARELGLSCETLRVSHEDPYQAIIDAAAKRGCDLIAMASHGRRGMAAVVLGSQTQKVLTHSTTPVLVYRKPSWGPSPHPRPAPRNRSAPRAGPAETAGPADGPPARRAGSGGRRHTPARQFAGGFRPCASASSSNVPSCRRHVARTSVPSKQTDKGPSTGAGRRACCVAEGEANTSPWTASGDTPASSAQRRTSAMKPVGPQT